MNRVIWIKSELPRIDRASRTFDVPPSIPKNIDLESLCHVSPWTGVDTLPLNNAKTQLSRRLESGIRRTRNRKLAGAGRVGMENIHSVSIGRKISNSVVLDEPCISVQVNNKVSKSELTRAARIPPVVDGVPTDVVATGPAYAFVADGRYRPAACGCSMSSLGIGSSGCLVSLPADPPQQGRVLCFLGANHTFAGCKGCSEEQAPAWVYQPSPSTSPPDSSDVIGSVYAYACINFLQNLTNEVDCALARTSEADSDRLVYGIGPISSTPMNPQAGHRVAKFGTATGLTFGLIEDSNMSRDITYSLPTVRTARFVKLFKVSGGMNSRFAAPGDSGAVILDVETRSPVGIIVGGDARYTYGCRISTILSMFGARIEGSS